jgi:hypothetical protein
VGSFSAWRRLASASSREGRSGVSWSICTALVRASRVRMRPMRKKNGTEAKATTPTVPTMSDALVE